MTSLNRHSMTQPNTKIQDKKHVRQNTRIVPVIPKQYARKSLEKAPISQESEAGRHANGSTVPITTESSVASQTDSLNGTTHASSESPVSSISEHESRNSVAVNEKPTTAPQNGNGHIVLEDGARIGSDTPTASAAVPERRGSVDQSKTQTNEHVVSSSTSRVSGSNAFRASGKLPPPFYPASFSHPAEHNIPPKPFPAVDGPHFTFGGDVDSSAPSPIPPTSAGSWNSSGMTPNTDGISSPPPPSFVNGFHKPQVPVHSSSGQQGALQDHNDFFVRGQQHLHNQSQHSQPQFAGHQVQGSRQWQPSHFVHSPRSNSIGSNPPDAAFSPFPGYPGAPFPPWQAGQQWSDGGPQIPRHMSHPYQGHAYYPSRGSAHIDSRSFSVNNPDFHNVQSLRSHADSLFSKPDFADCTVRVTASTVASSASSSPAEIPAHKFVLSRSPRLRRDLVEKMSSGEQRTSFPDRLVLNIPEEAYFHDSSILPLALHYLYGGSLIRRDHLPKDAQSPRQVLSTVLSYAAAGWYLEMPEIATAGLALAADLLVPDSLDVALEFALRQPSSTESQPSQNGHIDTQFPSHHQAKYHPYASDFLHTILRFTAWPLTTNFEFDPSAPEPTNIVRIPTALTNTPGHFSHASRPSVSNPKLQGIQLGDFQLHSSTNRTLSAILLSLPTFVLQALFAHPTVLERLSPDIRADLLRSIVGEREKRRRSALVGFRKLPVEEQEGDSLKSAREAIFVLEEVEVAAENGLVRLLTSPVER